jgi:uncharacterized membrane protein YhfC
LNHLFSAGKKELKGQVLMELKAIIAIALVVFIVGAIVWLKIKNKNK